MKTKEEIILRLETNMDAFIAWVNAQEPERFNWSPAPDKWSTGQHVLHLLKSTQPLNLAYRVPYRLLAWWQGSMNRPERSYEELVARYKEKLAQGGRTSGPFVPGKVKVEDKQRLLTALQNETTRLVKAIRRQGEAALGQYLLPHPLLGKLSLREMLYFTVHHIEHHLRILEEKYA